VADDFNVIDRDARSETNASGEPPARGHPDLSSDLAPAQGELEQRSIRHERPSRLETRHPAPTVERRTGSHEDAHQPRRTSQGGEVRKGVRARSRRYPEAAVQQPVPDSGRDEVVRISHHFHVIDLAKRRVYRKLIGESF